MNFPVLESLQVGLGQGVNDGMKALREQWHREESQKPITVSFCEHSGEGKPQARWKGQESQWLCWV